MELHRGNVFSMDKRLFKGQYYYHRSLPMKQNCMWLVGEPKGTNGVCELFFKLKFGTRQVSLLTNL